MSTISAPTLDGPVPGVPGATVHEVETLPGGLNGGAPIGPYTQAAPGELLFEVPRIARYLVSGGTRIEVAVEQNADRAAAELFLHGGARGTLIHQRGELPLNAVTLIAPNWKCVAICGPSAFGKSMLGAVLCRSGWLLVADGITRVTWNGSMAVAWPSDDKLKLWRDCCEALRLDIPNLRRVRDRMERFYVPVAATRTPARLAALVHLRLASRVATTSLSAAEGAAFLGEDTFGSRQIDPLGCRVAHAHIAAQVSRSCQSFRLDGGRRSPIADLARQLSELMR